MKSSKSFIFNEKNEEIKMLSKEEFKKWVKKYCKIDETNYKLTQKYSDIIKNYPDILRKLANGIYYKRISDNNILICLLDKNVEDFKIVYNKMTKSKEFGSKTKKTTRNIEKSSKTKKITDKSRKNKDKVVELDKETIIKFRSKKVDMKEIKKNIKKATIVGLAAVASMGLFACQQPKVIERPNIVIDQDANLDNGEKIKADIEKIENEKKGEMVKADDETKIEESTKKEDNIQNDINIEEFLKNDEFRKTYVPEDNTNNNANNINDNVNNNTNTGVNNNMSKEYKEGDPKPNTTDINEYRDWLRAQNKHPQGTDLYGNPFKKEGAEYTWSANGTPNEAPTNGIAAHGIQNPNTGTKYMYDAQNGWYVDNRDEREAEIERIGKLNQYGGVDEKTGKVHRKLTPEELKEISAMYSASFK